ERLFELWLGANQTTMLPGGPLPMFGRLIQGQDHLTTQTGLKRLLSKALPDGAMVEDASIRLAIVVTDAETGRREVLRQGPLQPAVLASSAIPGLFPPVRIGSRRFVDGGLAANCDIEAAIESGATDLMVVDLMGDGQPTATYSVAAVIERSIGIVMRRQTDLAATAFGNRARIAVLRADIATRPHPWDFSQTRFLYERGRQAADDFLGKHYRANRSVKPGLFRFETGQGLDAQDGRAAGPRAASEDLLPVR
ncbi:MAG TPA: patatin-like phospholipase family protein, partial [Candidatus Acidoferrum sp.]|nr:patatin-like phospholipase family protein [Candidatus Acidoferrum sp.]